MSEKPEKPDEEVEKLEKPEKLVEKPKPDEAKITKAAEDEEDEEEAPKPRRRRPPPLRDADPTEDVRELDGRVRKIEERFAKRSGMSAGRIAVNIVLFLAIPGAVLLLLPGLWSRLVARRQAARSTPNPEATDGNRPHVFRFP